VLCYAVLIDSEQQLRRILFILACGSLIVGAGHSRASRLPIGPSTGLQAGRAQGGVGDPNFFANIQLVVLPIVLVLAADTKVRWMRYFLGFCARRHRVDPEHPVQGRADRLDPGTRPDPVHPGASDLPVSAAQGGGHRLPAVALLLFSRPTFRAEVVKRAHDLQQAGFSSGDSSAGSA
jgi:hypothetical protein